MKILKRFEVIVFENGSIEFHEMTDSQEIKNDDSILNLNECSSRIAQILSVIAIANRIQQGQLPILADDSISNAISETSKLFKVSIQSVMDKLTRQIELPMSEFRAFVRDFTNGERSEEFKNILISHADSKNKKGKDLRAIEAIWKNPEQEMLFSGQFIHQQ